MSTRYAAERFGVTRRRIQQLVKEYRDIKVTGKKKGRKREKSRDVLQL